VSECSVWLEQLVGKPSKSPGWTDDVGLRFARRLVKALSQYFGDDIEKRSSEKERNCCDVVVRVSQ
jgi:hypothetical protein